MANNLTAVNEALNDLYIEEENYDALRKSVDTYDNLDLAALAQKCEKHDLMEFRRLAAYMYKKKGRFAQSVELSKADECFQDATETAAGLFTMFDYLKPDVVLELAYRFQMMDYALPYL